MKLTLAALSLALAYPMAVAQQTKLPMTQIAPPKPISGTAIPAGACVMVAVPVSPSAPPSITCVPLALLFPPALQPSQFYSPQAPLPSITLSCRTAHVFLNGLRIGAPGDYVLDATGLVLTFTGYIPGAGDNVVVDYGC